MLIEVPKGKVHSKRKSTGSHYTPEGLAKFLAKRLLAYAPSEQNFRILDPACGDGELLSAISEELPYATRLLSTYVGIDQNVDALVSLRSSWSTGALETREDDFLTIPILAESDDLFESTNLGLAQADLIIANPPYVRTQVLGAERAQQLALAFDLTGRVDLYQAFLVAMTSALKPGGLMGVITSNRFLSTKGASSIRSFLASNYDILEVIDLGDTKLFEAAVLPAIFIGRRRAKGDRRAHPESKFLRVYEDLNSASAVDTAQSIYDLLEGPDGFVSVGERSYRLVSGTITFPEPGEPWQLVCGAEEDFIRRMESCSSHSLSDLMHVRVGVKTTADKVFIREDWPSLPLDQQPEPELLRPIIDSSDASKWSLSSTPLSRKLLYPYTVNQSKRQVIELKDFPRAKSYFEHFRARLEGRTYLRESSREWFEIWVPHHPDAWRQPMLVAPDISASPKFAYTNEGATVNGNCYWLTLKPGVPHDFLFLVLGIANSSIMTKYHDLAFNNKLYAGRRRYLSQYLDKYPIPDLSSSSAKAIVATVRRLVFEVLSQDVLDTLESEIEAEVGKLYGVAEK